MEESRIVRPFYVIVHEERIRAPQYHANAEAQRAILNIRERKEYPHILFGGQLFDLSIKPLEHPEIKSHTPIAVCGAYYLKQCFAQLYALRCAGYSQVSLDIEASFDPKHPNGGSHLILLPPNAREKIPEYFLIYPDAKVAE